ncbi:Retrovirus-related Pol polyprotein from transposon opus [Vitis vinifera]|uniref:RNA-directed DNA polymerase n=1 Tax=Vitis vinifera TaxID=29760 RepID=A0A438H0L2_VITVI|nr:Retrovirus-related Pol polyprotein from transposon opus [Vitis vinifera]
MDGMQNDLYQKIDNIQYSISRLTNLNTVNEKGKFPSQPSQNPKGVHEVETQEGDSSKLREVKAVITLRSGKEVDQPLPKVRQDEELLSKKPLVKESNNQEEESGKKSASKSSIEEEPRIMIKEDMMKKHMPPPFPQALHGKKEIKNSSEILEVLRQGEVSLQLSIKIRVAPPLQSTLEGHLWRSFTRLGGKCEFAPYSVYKPMGLGGLKPTAITLSLADRFVKIPRGVIEDVLVQVDKFYYPVDFVVLDTDPTVKEANYVPIILGRPFLATSNAIINCRNGMMQLTFGNMTLELNIFHLCKRHLHPDEDEGLEEVCLINTLVEEHCDKSLEESLNESLEVFEEGGLTRSSYEDPPKLVLKPLPVNLKYAYLEEDEKCLVVVSSNLTSDQEDSLLGVLRKCKKAIGWKISDLKGISPLVCTHHIYMEEDAKPVRQPQRRLNPHMQEVVRGEVLKLLQARIIYPISDSLWVSPTQVVPKKSGITVIQNEKGEEVSTTSYLRMEGHPFYYFLDGYSGYFQIEIDLEDEEKTTFTCPFGTFAYRRMPFGLCNAPATFQRCMLSIFSDMVEHIMEVFMDDITCQKSFEELKQFLATAPIVRAPNWKLPFEVMCDANDLAMGVVLGQREDGKPYVIYYASKTLNEAQRNYTTTEKELLAVVFALDKFRAYLVGSSIVVFTDHSTLKYLLTKQDAKARLIRWILLLQEFNLQIQDKKGVENVVADHLSRLVIAHDSHGLPINDDFPEESLMSIDVAPWYSHIENYLVTGEVQESGVPKTRGISLLRSMPIIGRSLFSSNIVRIKS